MIKYLQGELPKCNRNFELKFRMKILEMILGMPYFFVFSNGVGKALKKRAKDAEKTRALAAQGKHR